MRHLLVVLALASAPALAADPPATPASDSGISVELGAGADQHWTDPREGLLQVTLAAEMKFGDRATIGGRAGGALMSKRDPLFAIPTDLVLGVHFTDLYVELLGGPWILPDRGEVLAHAAAGVGVETKSMALGVEAGYLEQKPIAGLRFTMKL